MAKVVSAKDETVRLFKSDFCEFFSHVHWSVPLIIYLPPIFFFTWKVFFASSLKVTTSLLLVLAGLCFWTFTEYTMHRFLFHFKPKKYLKRFYYTIHEIHHDYPGDSTRLVMPPILSIPLAILFYFIFSYFLPHQLWQPFYIGFGTGYLCYDMIHYSTHHVNMKGSWGKFLKKYHLQHHFQESDKGYGVSSPVWDLVFKTRPLRLGQKG